MPRDIHVRRAEQAELIGWLQRAVLINRKTQLLIDRIAADKKGLEQRRFLLETRCDELQAKLLAYRTNPD